MDLSYQMLTNAATHEKLRELKEKDPKLWNKLTESTEILPLTDDIVPEDAMELDDVGVPDDSEIPVQILVNNIIESGPAAKRAEGLRLDGIAEQPDPEEAEMEREMKDEEEARNIAEGSKQELSRTKSG
ncbi:hypothetical protein BT96DRAFT_945690 [Gymnopus androsaceus JB14]|uniref:Uncharacterized protein n=1 Tax=Gymnopus androsaceus JB14 TaxID=1447944 RepID=A0A6A4H030_9AGAR|nr:hypothetical protein BT96DRAFT_945690 [Gymnopus androsaceus JB14]